MSRVSRSLNSISRNLSSTFQTGYTQSRCVYQQFAYIFYSYRSIFLTLFVYLVSNPQPFYSSVFLRRSTARANSLSSREMLPIRFSLVSSRTKIKRKRKRKRIERAEIETSNERKFARFVCRGWKLDRNGVTSISPSRLFSIFPQLLARSRITDTSARQLLAIKRRETRGNFDTQDSGSRGSRFSKDRSNPFAINGNRRLPLSIEESFDRPNLLFSPAQSIRASLTNLRQSDLSE